MDPNRSDGLGNSPQSHVEMCPDCLFVGLVGVAGSVTFGRHVTLAGQVGVNGHLTVGDNVRFIEEPGDKGPQASTVRLLAK